MHEILKDHDIRSVARNRRFDFPLSRFLAIDQHQPLSLIHDLLGCPQILVHLV
jgi:hypothetical protein